MKKLISLLLVTAFVIGCGKEKEAGTAPLSADQKAQLKELAIASGRPIVAGAYAAKSTREVFNPGKDEATLKMAAQLKQSVFYGNCSNTWVNKTDSSSGLSFGAEQLEFALNGVACPVDLAIKVENKNAPGKIGQFWKAEYKAKDAELIALNDVSEFKLGGFIDINYDSNGINGAGKIDGNILSKKYGTVDVVLTHSIVTGSNEVTYTQTNRLVFSGFTAEIQMVRKMHQGGSTTDYTLNGVTVSKDELRDLLSGNALLDIAQDSK